MSMERPRQMTTKVGEVGCQATAIINKTNIASESPTSKCLFVYKQPQSSCPSSASEIILKLKPLSTL